MLEAVSRQGRMLAPCLPDHNRKCFSMFLVLASKIAAEAGAKEFASEELQADRDVVLTAVRTGRSQFAFGRFQIQVLTTLWLQGVRNPSVSLCRTS